MDNYCSAELTDPKPIVLTPPVDMLPSDAGSVAVSETEHNLIRERTLGMRMRCGRVVRPVVRLIKNTHQKGLAGC